MLWHNFFQPLHYCYKSHSSSIIRKTFVWWDDNYDWLRERMLSVQTAWLTSLSIAFSCERLATAAFILSCISEPFCFCPLPSSRLKNNPAPAETEREYAVINRMMRTLFIILQSNDDQHAAASSLVGTVQSKKRGRGIAGQVECIIMPKIIVDFLSVLIDCSVLCCNKYDPLSEYTTFWRWQQLLSVKKIIIICLFPTSVCWLVCLTSSKDIGKRY